MCSESRKLSKAKERHKRRSPEAVIDFTMKDWRKVCDHFKGCIYCGGPIETKEHLEAVSEGGQFTKVNIFPACLHCNQSKSGQQAYRWYKAQPFFSKKRWNKIIRWRRRMRKEMEKNEEVYNLQ